MSQASECILLKSTRWEFVHEWATLMAQISAKGLVSMTVGNWYFSPIATTYVRQTRWMEDNVLKQFKRSEGYLRYDMSDGKGYYLIKPTYVEPSELPIAVEPSDKRVKQFDLVVVELTGMFFFQRVSYERMIFNIDDTMGDRMHKRKPVIQED